MKEMSFLCVFMISLIANGATASTSDSLGVSRQIVYKINIKEDIMPSAWRQVQKGFAESNKQNANIVLFHLNTYGGMVNMADSIRTKILNSRIPVWVFIDNQAASAGALISIACDSIYIRPGGSIGAATVVNQTGEVAPDKYQSFMRGIMRATAEAKGKDTIVVDGKPTVKWRRDPRIAEAMVDPTVVVEGLVDDTKVLTFTADEAMEWGYCEGKCESVAQLLEMVGIKDYVIVEYKPTPMDKMIGFLTHPVVSGILIMMIIGGIYFELQTPGVGFPLVVALLGAILFFAPHYLEGLAEHYELIIFIIGIVLIIIEIFAIPGFGIVGISGIVLVVLGLTLGMIDNNIFRDVRPFAWVELLKPLVVVSVALFSGLILSIALSRKLLTSPTFPGLSLSAKLSEDEGYIGIDRRQKEMIGKIGRALTVLRPSGKVVIDDEIFDAVSEDGFIGKGEEVKVIKDEAGQIYVMRI